MTWNPEKFLTKIIETIGSDTGMLSICHDPDSDSDFWLVGLEFGREAEDSPMAGGAAYGTGKTLAEAAERVAEEMGWT